MRFALSNFHAHIQPDSQSQQIHNGLNCSSAMRLNGGEITRKVDNFNDFRNVLCLKVKFSCGKTTGYLRCIHFCGKQCKCDQMHQICISQGTVIAFLRRERQIQNNRLPEISSGFCVVKLFKLFKLLTTYSQNKSWTFLLEH